MAEQRPGTTLGWVINRCAHGHRWASEDKSTHCPVCGTSTWKPETKA